jgi:phage-related protein
LGLTTYSTDDIVIHGSKFYYCIQGHSGINTPAVGSAYWGGSISADGAEQHEFIWSPSYSLTANQQPNVLAIKFGNGYEQRLKEGINNNLLSLDLKFESRSETETVAITHFLNDKEGYKSFWFKTPSPFNVTKKFVSRSWSISQLFDDNYTISSKFDEVP